MNRWDLLFAAGTLVSLVVSLMSAFLVVSGKQWREAQDKARARRLADAKMNARLLRLNIT